MFNSKDLILGAINDGSQWVCDKDYLMKQYAPTEDHIDQWIADQWCELGVDLYDNGLNQIMIDWEKTDHDRVNSIMLDWLLSE